MAKKSRPTGHARSARKARARVAPVELWLDLVGNGFSMGHQFSREVGVFIIESTRVMRWRVQNAAMDRVVWLEHDDVLGARESGTPGCGSRRV